MEERCPTCDRAFKSYSDYPLIKVVRFEKVEMPDNVKFPESETFHGINRVPQEVVAQFRTHPSTERFEFNGTWTLDGNWNGTYYRKRANAKSHILNALSPYLTRLESLVGSTIPSEKISPELSEKFGLSENIYEIADSKYLLALQEFNDQWRAFERPGMTLPKLETGACARKLALIIAEVSGGSVKGLKYLASVAGIAYEGKLKQ